MSIKPLLLPLLLCYMMTSCKGAAPCKLRVYLARAEQTDENGLKCWDTVKVAACGGRCDSREIELVLILTPHHQKPILLALSTWMIQEGEIAAKHFEKRMVRPCPLCSSLGWGTAVPPDVCHLYENWEFPFKKSHHPVCLYGSRRPLMVRLRHCNAGVATGTDVFHYIAAEDCRCKVCSSEYTSCEWMPPNSTLMDGVDGMDFEDLEEEYNE